jgi:hypothetical protein
VLSNWSSSGFATVFSIRVRCIIENANSVDYSRPMIADK